MSVNGKVPAYSAKPVRLTLAKICDTILDETSSHAALSEALNEWVKLCSEVTDVCPDLSYDAWAPDSLMKQGVAINPQAAAQCALDYMRSVIFIRGVYAAINTLRVRLCNRPVEILYAGCGPYGTLIVPLLSKFSAGDVKLHLLDIHQASLTSVMHLINHFGFAGYAVETINANACDYKHPSLLDLVVAETMQKSLEQEPQFAVTANLAAQLASDGVFIPQSIEVVLSLADLANERRCLGSVPAECGHQQITHDRVELATLCNLSAETALAYVRISQANAHIEPPLLFPSIISIPDVGNNVASLFTRIRVFQQYSLGDYESQITLPLQCHELSSINRGERYRVSYVLGAYPKFNFEQLTDGT